MNASEISALRLQNQQISKNEKKTAADLVNWMGAIQAQDYPMSKLAIGVRVKESTNVQVESDLDTGELLRTHVLRPTWHLVSPTAIHGMLQLSAANVKRLMKSNEKSMELSDKIISKSTSVLEKALAGHQHQTRDELKVMLEKAKINIEGNRMAHLLMHAELDGVICSGISKGISRTYALLDERVSNYVKMDRNQALEALAKTYFSSHGPATVADFAWWSGCSIKDSRIAVESLGKKFVSFEFNAETFYLLQSNSGMEPKLSSVYLLPAFDEFLISYKSRSASLDTAFFKHAFTTNGIFKPIVVIDGMVKGIWNKITKKNQMMLEFDYFTKVNKSQHRKVEEEAREIGNFFDLPVTIKHKI